MDMTILFFEMATLLLVIGGSVALFGGAVLTALGESSALGAAQLLVPTICCALAYYYNDLFDLRLVGRFGEFLNRAVRAFGFFTVLMAVCYLAFPSTRLGDDVLVSLATVLPTVFLVSLFLHWGTWGLVRSRAMTERVLVLGQNELARRVAREIEDSTHFRHVLVGFASEDGAHGEPAGHAEILARLSTAIEDLRPDRIIVALTEQRNRVPVAALLRARSKGVRVEMGAKALERITGKLAIECLTPSYLLYSDDFSISRLSMSVPRVLSLLVAGVGLLVAAPLMLLIAILIKVDSNGRVFFVQDRVGRHGSTFRLFKFRTMHPGDIDDESVWSRDDEARITRVGRLLRKLRLDELPQFFNILNGDMNLIGPRPEMASNVAAMTEHIPYYNLRHLIRPGLTGWAQINNGYAVSLEEVAEKVRYDLYYLKNRSLWMDLHILATTMKIVLFGRGAR